MKKEKKESYKIVFILLIILLLMGYGTYLIIDIKIVSNNVNTSTNEISIKVDDTLDYVYDANYNYQNKYTEYKRTTLEDNATKTISYYGIDVDYTIGMQYLSNLKVPYININSTNANRVNKEMAELYLKYSKQFDTCSLDKVVGCSQILTYRTYIYNDILSIIVIDSIQYTSNWVLNYHTYNFDLTNGNLLSYYELLDKLGYDKDDTLTKIEELTKLKIENLYGEYENDFITACNGNCYEKANNLILESIDKNNILVFINNFGKLNVMVIPFYSGIQNGEINHYLITLEK